MGMLKSLWGLLRQEVESREPKRYTRLHNVGQSVYRKRAFQLLRVSTVVSVARCDG